MDKKIIEFPDVENKLQAPTKQSVFERQKREAEAKRLREEAETAAVYEDFVKSFDDEDVPSAGFGGHSGFGGVSGPPKRHFGGSSIPTGPGGGRVGFGPGRGFAPLSGPGSLGPPPQSLSRKRTHENFQQGPRGGADRGLLAFDDYDSSHKDKEPRRAFNTSDDEEERRYGGRGAEPPVPKPTLRLSSLPPGTSPAVIKSLIPSNLTIDAVRIIPPSGPGVAGERKSMSAIVTLAKETAANDIDAAVNGLQHRYLGYGFYLSLHRHLSSAALSSAPTASGVSGASSQPFGAKPVHIDTGTSHGPAGPHRGFAPPTSYAPTGPGQQNRNTPLLHVPVQAPKDIKELKMIHKTIESLLTHGPEFEALLMSRPEVQREEKWAWIWDPRSMGGIWYRWRLWEVLTGSQTRRGQGKYLPLFEDSAAWKAPDEPLPYEYTTRLDEFVSDSEYNSSDDDDSGDEGAPRRPQHRSGGPPDSSILNTDDGTTYLNPLEKAKLTHLLARLPNSTGKLRKGDVARVTAFAISHAGRGADEVVSLIISNIDRPFTYTSANPDQKKEKDNSGDDIAVAMNDEEDKADQDTSSASLIGLYVVSDILSSSSTSGVRHAWRYRQLFETALRSRLVFENLGRLEKRMSWGRLRAEKWKRSVANVLGLWEGWCVFPQESQDHFVNVFNNPPVAKEEENKIAELMAAKAKNKWKAVEVAAVETAYLPVSTVANTSDGDDVDGMPMEDEDVDGEPMDEDVDGEPMEDIDGEPMEEDDNYQPSPPDPASNVEASGEKQPSPVPTKRVRPRAVDMFADSGSDGD
jgi:U2-associated protein SR140